MQYAGVITVKQDASRVNPSANFHPSTYHHLNGLIGAEEGDTEGEAERILWNANYNNQIDTIILVQASKLI